MASSSSSSRTLKYDVFPSFSGEDVRKSFLSHLLKELNRRSIITFIDHGIERSSEIAAALLSAIRESRISIVVFSKTYASSTWCLNELAAIHECKGFGLMVIPVFYDVDPSDVRKQTGDFGKAFDATCNGKTEDEKQRWIQALREVADIAGEDSRNWSDEAKMIEQISNDVSNKLFTPSDDFRDFVGIGAHVEAIMDSMLCLESEDVRMVGILGPSGIGKSTIARALYSRISSQFHHRAFVSFKRTTQNKTIADFDMKLSWAKHFLSEILCQKDIKIESLGAVEQRLKHRKVLIVLDDVDKIELLETLVGQIGWFGFGSRIIVVTQDRQILKSHEIELIHEVEFPSREVALRMFCRSAFRRNSPPDGFKELAVEVAELAGNLPLGLDVLGGSLRKKDKEHWVDMMHMLRYGLNGEIERTLRVSYDGLDEKDYQDLFVYIACLFNGESVNYIKNLLETSFRSVNTSLRTLADKSLLRIITPLETVEMHILLQKLGREIVRAESINNPGKRRFLVDAKDISDVFNDNTGTENVLGIHIDTSEIYNPLSIDEKAFEGMRNLQFIKFYIEWWRYEFGKVRLYLPRGLFYLPRKLRLLHWDEYPAKCLPSSFSAEYLVELKMVDSKLEKLWEGAQPCRSLKVIDLSGSRDLKEIPDLSNATNLEILDLCNCTSLVTLPSSIRNLKKLIDLSMSGCSNLEVLPTDVNLESLDYLNLEQCSRLKSFPQLSTSIERLYLSNTAIEEVPSWIENIVGLTHLWMICCKRLKIISANIWKLENLYSVDFTDCGGVTSVSDASVFYPDSGAKFFFSNCFSLHRVAHELILQANSRLSVLPAQEVPTYFTHQTSKSYLSVSLDRLPQSSLPPNYLLIKVCIILGPATDFQYAYPKIIVHWRFRNEMGAHKFKLDVDSTKLDHLVVFYFHICLKKDSPPQLDCNRMEFKVELHRNDRCLWYHIDGYGCDLNTCPDLPHKGCGIRVLNVSSTLDANDRNYETEYNHHQLRESDAESGRSKKRMRMTSITTLEEPSNSLCGQAVADTGFPAPAWESLLHRDRAGSDLEAFVKSGWSSSSGVL